MRNYTSSIGCRRMLFNISSQFCTGFPHDFHTFSTMDNDCETFTEAAFAKFSTIWAGPIYIYIIYNYIIKEYVHRRLDTTLTHNLCIDNY